jgi:hypothetical protein
MLNEKEILEKFKRAKEKWRSASYHRNLRFHTPRHVYFVRKSGQIWTYLKVHHEHYLNLQDEAFYSLPSCGDDVLATEDPKQARQTSIKMLAAYCKRQEENLRKHVAEIEQQQAELEASG